MKKIFLLLIIISIVLYTPIEKLENAIDKTFNFFHITKTCYKANEENFIEIFKQEGFDYIEEDKKITARSLNNILNLNQTASNLKIPAITHHIYFFSKSAENKINPFVMQITNNSIERLTKISQELEWKHYIWTNDILSLKSNLNYNSNYIYKNFDEFKNHPLYQKLIEAIKSNEIARFSEASDILRFMVIEQYGGIYMDMDYEIYNAAYIIKLMKNFDFIAGRESAKTLSNYGSAFLAAKPNHPIAKEMVSLELRNYSEKSNRPAYIKYPCYTSTKIIFNAPTLVTTAFFKKNNLENNNDLILPSWMIYNFGFARDKNKNCRFTGLNLDNFIKESKNIKKLTQEFNQNLNDNHSGNIYYSYGQHKDFDIIGADMFCATWARFKKRIYHWSWKE